MSSEAPRPANDDPHGDQAFLAERRRQRGRSSILTEGEDFTGGGGDDGGDDGGEEKKRLYGTLRIQRIKGTGETVWVPVDLTTEVSSPCPVQVLGMKDGAVYVLDPLGQLRILTNLGQNELRMLFGRYCGWLDRHFPQFDKNKGWKGFQAQYAQQALYQAAGSKPVFDTRDRVRGLGCWKDDEGRLIQHLGNVVLVDGAEHEPGEIGEHVYPGRPKVPPPIPDARDIEMPAANGGTVKMNAGEVVFEHFASWRWARGDLDARLLLGQLGCAILGGALDWRPHAFITGDAGTGKSTLQEHYKKVLPGRLASTVDATPAALRQIINQDAIGVSFDEIEADYTNDQAVHVMKLARTAASGGTVYRGGQDHKAADFQLRGCFLFSAIIPPSMRMQDMQRITFLRLYPLPKGQKLAKRSEADWRKLGQRLAWRMADGWERFEETREVYEQALMDKGGHAQRGARQFGTLLAAADLLLFDSVPTADVAAEQVRGLERSSLYEYEQADPTWLTTFKTILAATFEHWRGSQFPTVVEVVRDWILAPDPDDKRRIQRKLNRVGLAIITERRTGEMFLAVHPRHSQIKTIFAQSDLRAHGGEGAWSGVLRGGDPYHPTDNAKGSPEGHWRANNVPQLDSVKCVQIRLGAKVDLQGVLTPIFLLDPDAQDGGAARMDIEQRRVKDGLG